jgi:hypothetical protein
VLTVAYALPGAAAWCHGPVHRLDGPDNYLDVPGKRWLEEALANIVGQPRP